ncbi:MAG: uroporphyrinogen decarboxylase family protein [Anaerolineae bacterium]
MNAKENALRIIRFDHLERVVEAFPSHYLSYRGCNHEGYEGGGHHLPVGSRWVDIWGTLWQREHEGVMGFPRGNPLAELVHALPHYRWPDPDDERIYAQIATMASGWDRENTFLLGSHRDTLWEKSYMLVGMENMMCYFYTEPNAVRELLHHIMDFQLGIARPYLDAGVEIVSPGDDLGTQIGLLLSPSIIHEFLVPEYRRLFDLYHERGVLISFHSCGHITPLVNTFMDLHIDILNPLQASANDLTAVRAVTQGRMALMGGIESDLIMRGPALAIRNRVAERIGQLAASGGYFCGPDQGLPWPQEHYRAMQEAIHDFGAYSVDDRNHQLLTDDTIR